MAIRAIGAFQDEAADEYADDDDALDRFEVPNGLQVLMDELREKFPYDEDSQTLGRVEVFEDCIHGEQEGLQHFARRYEAAVRGMHREGIDLPM
eukprot:6946981-Prorocentrum_lima.AAC.1